MRECGGTTVFMHSERNAPLRIDMIVPQGYTANVDYVRNSSEQSDTVEMIGYISRKLP